MAGDRTHRMTAMADKTPDWASALNSMSVKAIPLLRRKKQPADAAENPSLAERPSQNRDSAVPRDYTDNVVDRHCL